MANRDMLLIRTGSGKNDVKYDQFLNNAIATVGSYVTTDGTKANIVGGLTPHVTSYNGETIKYTELEGNFAYYGDIKDPSHIVNKKYVDNAITTASTVYMPINGEELVNQSVTITSTDNSKTGGIHIEHDNVSVTQNNGTESESNGILIENGTTTITGNEKILLNSNTGKIVDVNGARITNVEDAVNEFDAINLGVLNSRITPLQLDPFEGNCILRATKKTETIGTSFAEEEITYFRYDIPDGGCPTFTVDYSNYHGIIYFEVKMRTDADHLYGSLYCSLENPLGEVEEDISGHVQFGVIQGTEHGKEVYTYVLLPVFCNNFKGDVEFNLSGFYSYVPTIQTFDYTVYFSCRPLFYVPLVRL